MLGSGLGRVRFGRVVALTLVVLAAAAAWVLAHGSIVHATSGGDPYSSPDVVDTNPDPNVVETTLTAGNTTVDIGGGVTAHAMTFNGAIPGPTFKLKVGDTVIVHFKNNMTEPSGIHWHGVELSNEMDGTPYTQDAIPPGGSFLYKFKVTRPGIFWYHPHHVPSTDEVFRGMYGMIVVADPNEAALQNAGTLPSVADTRQIVLSDTTVCKAQGSNDPTTYPNAATQGWVGNANGAPPTPPQVGPTPTTLCDTNAIDDAGNTRGAYAAQDIPAIQPNAGTREVEGQTVLTNGKNVGGRGGYPANPAANPDAGASLLNVRPGQGLRLQFVNASAIRFMRLHLTTKTGTDVPLIRVGGEGGLLDSAVIEGNTQPVPAGVFDSQYFQGEILLPPGSRADVVAAIPSSATGVMTMWTEDYQRIGNGSGFSDTPTVPVMHLNVTGSPVSPAYSIAAGTPLRLATNDPVPVLGPPTGTLLNPGAFSPTKLGDPTPAIAFDAGGGKGQINGTPADHPTNYETANHLNSSRYAKVGDTLELTVTNNTAAHHPFHLHGFSIQPLDLTKAASPTYTWPYHEFRDNVDIPPHYTLRFRVRLDDRPLPDATTPGGAYGRWMFHCHIFFHAELGMLSELVVVPPNGKERPDINVDTTQVNVNQGQTATATGSFFDIDGEAVHLSSSVGTMTINGGHFTWSFPTGTANSQFVYLTATNADGTKAQIPFFLNITNTGAPTLHLPGRQTAFQGGPLRFGISATDPDAVDVLTLGASGLPRSLRFADNHNRTGQVSGTVSARPGVYTSTFTANDGHHPPVSGTVRITVTPPELKAGLARRLRVSKGAISVKCVVLHRTLRTCTVTVFLGRKRVGRATVRLRKSGKSSITVKVKLNAATLRKISHSKKGIKLKIVLSATEFGSPLKLTASANATALAAAKRKKH